MWRKAFKFSSVNWQPLYIFNTHNGYFLVGNTDSTSSDIVVVKLDTNFNVVNQSFIGGIYSESISDANLTYDGGLIMAGRTYSYGSGNSDSYLIKINSDGLITKIPLNLKFDKQSISLYPNPTNKIVNIESKNKILKINTYSSNGKLLQQKALTSNFYQLSLPEKKGLYFLEFIDISGKKITKKVIKE